jgi:hypothetical protein
MSAVFEIPLEPKNQQISVQFGLVVYLLRLTWLASEDNPCWILDILDEEGVPVLTGVPLVSGADLFEAFPDLAFGGKLYCGHDGDMQAPPLYADLGSTSHLYWQPD